MRYRGDGWFCRGFVVVVIRLVCFLSGSLGTARADVICLCTWIAQCVQRLFVQSDQSAWVLHSNYCTEADVIYLCTGVVRRDWLVFVFSVETFGLIWGALHYCTLVGQ